VDLQYLNNQNSEYSIIQTKLPQILTHWSLSSLVTLFVDIFVLPVIIPSIWLLLDVLVGIELFK